jgi:hypothetical protein
MRWAGAALWIAAAFFGNAAGAANAATAAQAAPLPPEELEYELKVEFIKRFADYVEWPAHAFASDTAAFNICTMGDGPLRRRVQAKLGRGRAKGRRVAVRALKAPQEAGGCHVLYIAPSERAEVGNIVRELGRAPILTIGDTAGFGKRGVLINMFVEGTHIRFAINAPASKANGLSVSAKLLVLARPGENGG